MPQSVLTQKRSLIAWFAVLAMIASLIAIAQPASAHSVQRDTSATCPSTIPNAGFIDISGFDAETQQAINCIAHYGISIGTSSTTYSPNLETLRRHMALFLIRSAADMGIAIPAPSNQGFQDISTLPQAEQDAINQLSQLGITRGTSTTTFSPNQDVDRWEMALFLQRLLNVAGFTFPDDATHGNFADTLTLSAEAQAAIDDLADAHIALGVGGSLYAPFNAVSRWQMSLFLTRTLAADGVIPTGLRVSVTPTDAVAQSTGTSRTFTATFQNADGTPYTGRVGLEILDTTAGDAPIYNNKAENVTFTATTDALPASGMETNGFPGSNGQVTVTITHDAGSAEQVVLLAWEDLDADNSYETGGNAAPLEPFAVGGVTDFVVTAAGEAGANTYTGGTVTKTTKASDVFEATVTGPTTNCTNGAGVACSFFYDANDLFTVGGSAANLQEFEDALSRGDTLASFTYDPDPADQSTFNLTDVIAPFDVTDPGVEPDPAVTVDAATYAIEGVGDPSATVRIYHDDNDSGTIDGLDAVAATGTVDLDGNWTVTVSLTQETTNHFTATHDPVGAPVESAASDVSPIIESTSAGATLTSTVGTEGGAVEAGLGPGDTITITFSEPVINVSSGDTVSMQDTDGTTATLTLGSDVSFALSSGDTVLTLTVNVAVPGSGGTTGGIDGDTNITAISGFTDDDGQAINVTGSGAGRTFIAP